MIPIRRKNRFFLNAKANVGRYTDESLPVLKMWAAVMNEAIDCVRHRRVVGANNAWARRMEIERACEWFLNNDMRMGSFLWVCQVLELDPNAIRTEIGWRDAVSATA